MDYPTLVKISVSTGGLFLALAGCQEIESSYRHIESSIESSYRHVKASLLPEDRTPGEKLRVQPEEVWANENCSFRKLPFLRLDANEVNPATVRPGEKFNHRFVYTMCSDPRYGPIYGRTRTSIYYNSQKIHTDTATDFAVKDGTWIVDADVVVPYDARPGTYWLEAEFKGPGASFRDRTSFVVEP